MRCEELRTGFCRKQGVSEEPTIRPVFGSAVLRNPHPQFWPFRAKMRVRHLLIFCLCLSCSWPTWGRATLFLGRLRNLNSEEVDFLAFILVFGTTLIAQMVKNLPVIRRPQFYSWVRKIPWRRQWQPTPVFLPGESQGLYSPRAHKESNTTERLSLSLAPRGPLLRISHNIYKKPSVKKMHKTREM